MKSLAVPLHLKPPIRQIKYLNNIVEQDHRAEKRIAKPITSFKSFRATSNGLAGIELMHRIRKGQMIVAKRDERSFADQVCALAAQLRPVPPQASKNANNSANLYQRDRTESLRHWRRGWHMADLGGGAGRCSAGPDDCVPLQQRPTTIRPFTAQARRGPWTSR